MWIEAGPRNHQGPRKHHDKVTSLFLGDVDKHSEQGKGVPMVPKSETDKFE